MNSLFEINIIYDLIIDNFVLLVIINYLITKDTRLWSYNSNISVNVNHWE